MVIDEVTLLILLESLTFALTKCFMKILFINQNTTGPVTQVLAQENPQSRPKDHIQCATPPARPVCALSMTNYECFS